MSEVNNITVSITTKLYHVNELYHPYRYHVDAIRSRDSYGNYYARLPTAGGDVKQGPSEYSGNVTVPYILAAQIAANVKVDNNSPIRNFLFVNNHVEVSINGGEYIVSLTRHEI